MAEVGNQEQPSKQKPKVVKRTILPPGSEGQSYPAVIDRANTREHLPSVEGNVFASTGRTFKKHIEPDTDA